MRDNGFVPLVRVLRGERVESLHAGAAVIADAGGGVRLAAGDPAIRVYLRSTAKPFQAWPLVARGAADRFGLTPEELALACGSHGGEPFQVSLAQGMLRTGGFDPSHLLCGPHPPMHAPSARQLIREGREPAPLHNNCSGKHAGMLLLARHLDSDPAGYLEPSGPVQAAVRAAVAGHCAVKEADLLTATDGCSAPTFHLPLASLARGYAVLAAALGPSPSDPHLARVARAMADHPGMVAGTGRLDTALMEAARGRLLAKVGAEGLFAVAALTPGGPLGMAVKIADGDADRARTPLVLELLDRMQVLPAGALADVARRYPPILRNHRGLEVGRVEVELPAMGNVGK